ncbi:MAG: glycine zipper 2TM domain-containing protein [Dechloromonas sp.]|nr:MAG: glycine zipper 2TM domain-containing protein [Dechloromonas sp.]
MQHLLPLASARPDAGPAIVGARAGAVDRPRRNGRVRTPGNGSESGSTLGTVGGAVVGGVLGNQIGQGRGRTLATVGGAAGGAVVGNRLTSGTSTIWVVTVRYEDGTTANIEQSSQPPLRR